MVKSIALVDGSIKAVSVPDCTYTLPDGNKNEAGKVLKGNAGEWTSLEVR